MRPRVLVGSLGVLVITAGVSLAVAQELKTAADAAAAARAAIEAVRGEWATPSGGTEAGAPWRFQVVFRDGTSEEVTLDRALQVVKVGAIEASTARHVETSDDGRTDNWVAQAQPSNPMESQPAPKPAWAPFSSADMERAAQVALKAVGGGTVHDVDRESEGGSTWEVELTAADGRSMEVQLDAQFNVLKMGSERDANEGSDDRDDNEGSDDD